MKSVTLPTILVFVLAVVGYTLIIPRLGEVQRLRQIEQISHFGELPAPVVRALSLEFKGVVADFLMLQAMTHVGEKIGEQRQITRQDWQQLNRLLTKITDLDQRFWDPYLFAETMLAWEAGMIDEANLLLLKAAKHRPRDYRPYYFVGFNHFYFRQDSATAAPYIRRAARKPGAPYYLQGLAARLDLYGNETAVAITFLEEMLERAANPTVRKYLEKRLVALMIIHDLEQKVRAFKEETGRRPESFQEMIEAGLLSEIPTDPYGGEFVLLPNGRVYTTSELVDRRDAPGAGK